MSKISAIESALDFSKTGTGVSGFVNIGNTCYLNSALQILFHIEEIKKIFISTEKTMLVHPEYLNDRDISVYNCIKALYKGFWESDGLIRPEGIVRYLDENTYFSMGVQSDSTEVFTFLIQKLHESICMPKVMSEKMATNKLDLLSIKEWNLHLESKDSQLVNMFWGQYYIKNKCEGCGYSSHKFETFHYLTLPVVEEDEENPNSPISLNELIDNFMKKKKFDKDNKYFCDKCKTTVDDATNQSSVWKLPNYLIIQFKRYYEKTDCGFKRICKANRVIEYKDYFDPNTLLSSKCSKSEGEKLYKLHSGVFHYGSIHGGHYNCFTWNNDTKDWLLFDDDDCSKLDKLNLEDRNIYQLLYKLEDI